MTLYPNAGKSQISGDESFWGPMTEEIWAPQKWIFKDADRRDLHLVDWDGDGACDIVYTDPDKNNSPQVWLNTYPLTGRWDWTYVANPAPQVQCNERKGLGIHDCTFPLVIGTWIWQRLTLDSGCPVRQH